MAFYVKKLLTHSLTHSLTTLRQKSAGEKPRNLGGFAPASCRMDVRVYASMWIEVVDPVMRPRGSAGLEFVGTASDTRVIWPDNV